jgi:hypothetical protein
MCLTAWAEQQAPAAPGKDVESHKTLRIHHFEEAICYGYNAHEVEILATLLLSVQAPNSSLHLVHRKWVEMQDATHSILNPISNFEKALSQVSPARAEDTGKAACAYWQPPVGCSLKLENSDSDGRVRAEIPGVLTVSSDVREGYPASTESKARVPFTSCSVGPLSPTELPYLLRVRIRIVEPTFSNLIRSMNQYGVQYHYGIEGPAIVLKDIEQIDMRGKPPSELTSYREIYRALSSPKLVVPISSYTVLTLDDARATVEYNRTYVWTERIFTDQPRTVDTDSAFRVNGWHSTSPQFILQRVAFAEKPTEEDVGK